MISIKYAEKDYKIQCTQMYLLVSWIQFNILSFISHYYDICTIKILKACMHKYKELFNTEI